MIMSQTEYHNYAKKYLVGGISSSFRVNPFTGKSLYITRADGPFIYDLDGKQYIDFFMGHVIDKGLYFHTDFTVSAMHDEAVLETALEQIAAAARETVREI